jgi:hypothetical protein
MPEILQRRHCSEALKVQTWGLETAGAVVMGHYEA